MNRSWLGLVVLLAAAIGAAQTRIDQRRVLNAGSFIPWGMPGGGIARGSVFSIFGTGLGPPASPALAFPLSSNLGGVAIKVSAPGGTAPVDAIPLYVGPGQINAIMPSTAPLGIVSVVVTYNNIRSNPAPVKVVNSSFGIYAISGGGFGPGVFQNFVDGGRQPLNSLTTPAQPGQPVTIWGTGLGPVTFPDNVAPTPGSLPTKVEVFVGGKAAPVQYSGRSPCCSGTDQIVFTVPSDAPQGCWVPVQVRTEGTFVSNTATMAIGAAGTACSEPANPFGSRFASGGKLGWVSLFRVARREAWLADYTYDTTSEYSAATFRSEPGGAFAYNPFYSLPPAGTCSTYTGTGNLFWLDPIPGTVTTAGNLDAGALMGLGNLRQPIPKTQTAPVSPVGWFQTVLGHFTSTLLFKAGQLQVQGNGGADVERFTQSVPIPDVLTWSNRDQTPNAIDRSKPLTLNFSGVPNGHTVLVTGGYYSPGINATGMFTCVAPPSATSFTIPTQILQGVPARWAQDRRAGTGLLMVGSTPLANPQTFTANGLDYGAVFLTLVSAKNVVYQ
jgi:uncharacterized protein (TIGR03437 family)